MLKTDLLTPEFHRIPSAHVLNFVQEAMKKLTENDYQEQVVHQDKLPVLFNFSMNFELPLQ